MVSKQGNGWKVNGKTVNLYELHIIWLPEKYPGKRPFEVTAEMVAEFVVDRGRPNWYQQLVGR